MESKLIAEIQNSLGSDRVRLGELLGSYTTYRVGGPADCFYEARTVEELVAAARLARQLNIPYFILGLGANILIGDRGIRGLVIKNRCVDVEFVGANRLVAGSGAIIGSLIALAQERGLSGLEHFAGIPSTVGGALWQNLHFLSPDRQDTVYIEHVLAGATLLTQEDEIVEVGKEYFNFGYDQSVLHTRHDIVLKANFDLIPGSPAEIRHVADENLKWRGEKHPDLQLFPSAGSVFRKLEGLGAGRLIDQCGLKGHVIGQAQVSPKHANFIVNLGGATAADVRALIQLCKDQVQERFGVALVEEIMMVGEF